MRSYLPIILALSIFTVYAAGMAFAVTFFTPLVTGILTVAFFGAIILYMFHYLRKEA